jgi:transposase
VPARSKLTPELTERLAQLLRAGVSVELATSIAGIGERTFYTWLERGDPARRAKRDARYREFREVIERARAEHESILITHLNRAAAKGSWRAAAWLLERSFPERWAPAERRGPATSASIEEPTPDPFIVLEGDQLDARRRRRERNPGRGSAG